MRHSIAFLCLLLCLMSCHPRSSHLSNTAPTTAADQSIVEQENRGVGLMGRYDFDAAMVVFGDLVARHPELVEDQVNLAIATLNRQREGDSAAAMQTLERVLATHPDHPRARYCRGLLVLNTGKPAEALDDFRAAAQADLDDAYAAYYAGQCLSAAGKPAEALDAYLRAARLDPFLRSAHYGAFQALQQLRRADEAKAQLAEFQRLKNDLRARLVEFKYTRMGPLAEAVVSPRFETRAGRGPAANGPIFGEPVPLPIVDGAGVTWHVPKSDERAPCITAADIDGDGRIDLFITRAIDRGGRVINAVLLQRESRQFELALDHPLAQLADVNAALWGDFDNDGLTDVYLCSRGANQLWRQTAKNQWHDVSELTKTAGDSNADTIDGAFADLDHDGDLDLFLIRSHGPNELLNNNGDGTFKSIAKDAGVEGDGQGAIGLLVNDLDGDGDADICVIKRTPPNEVYLNDLSWRYHRATDASFQVPKSGRHETLVVLDRGPCLISIGRSSGSPVLIAPARDGSRFVTISFTGKNNLADQMRSNASGIGVKLAARIGTRWVAADTYRNSSGPGQSLQPTVIDLGRAKKIDFLRLLWPDGLRQTELDLRAGEHYAIAETQRQTSSCPVIFVWDGKKFTFVTDCLGVGGIGFATGKPGEYVEPRPRENVLLPEHLLRPRDGALVVKLDEPMEEACYLDSASLVAYDLPAGWSMTLDERMNVNDLAPTGEPRFYRRQMLPARATNDRGEDVTKSLSRIDGHAAPPPPSDPRFIGYLASEHASELTFDRPIDEANGSPMLIVDGWIEYPYSQTMFAAWQAHARYEAPTLEAQGADGRWVTLLDHFGYPAGMPRQMSVPIPRDKLPRGATRLRLRTTQEIYFDRIALAWPEDCPEAKRTVLPMTRAKLDEVGFAQRITHDQRRPDYDYSRRAPLWDAAHQDGFYTAFGNVEELLRATDDALAIFGPGEEVQMEFRAPAQDDPAPGWTRRYVLELAGWCKDRDLYTRDGETVEPIPRANASGVKTQRRDALHERFNTRYRSGE